MSWQGQMVTIVRHLINDVDDSNYTYTDSRIEQSLLVSAQCVLSEIDFDNTYTINVETCTMSPDPTTTSPKDDGFINLVCLKTACIMLGSELKTNSLRAIRVTDGPSSIDFGGVAGNLQFLYKNACDKYEKTKLNYQAGANSSGKAIFSPYSPGSDYIRDYYDFR